MLDAQEKLYFAEINKLLKWMEENKILIEQLTQRIADLEELKDAQSRAYELRIAALQTELHAYVTAHNARLPRAANPPKPTR